MSATEPLLKLDNVGISFGGLRAVDQLDFGVQKGQIVGLIGPNGAGKTTVFNMITGVYEPTDGRILWKGRDIGHLPPYKVAHCGILRTFQTIRLFADMSVLENVLAGQHMRTTQSWWAGLLGTPGQRREERELRDNCMQIIERLNLTRVANEPATSLPYGMQRRVELARTLAASPELLILDEPAAGLNDQESAELNAMIRDIRDSGITILLVEHDMNVVMSVTDQIVVINFGKKIAEGDPASVRRNDQVIEAYLGVDDEDEAAA